MLKHLHSSESTFTEIMKRFKSYTCFTHDYCFCVFFSTGNPNKNKAVFTVLLTYVPLYPKTVVVKLRSCANIITGKTHKTSFEVSQKNVSWLVLLEFVVMEPARQLPELVVAFYQNS